MNFAKFAVAGTALNLAADKKDYPKKFWWAWDCDWRMSIGSTWHTSTRSHHTSNLEMSAWLHPATWQPLLIWKETPTSWSIDASTPLHAWPLCGRRVKPRMRVRRTLRLALKASPLFTTRSRPSTITNNGDSTPSVPSAPRPSQLLRDPHSHTRERNEQS